MTDHDMIRREFPDYDVSTLPEIPEGFSCTAWHNDSCPTWQEGVPADNSIPAGVQIGADYPDPARRDDGHTECKRFFVQVLDAEGWHVNHILSSDDFEDIKTAIAFVKYVRDLGLGFHVDTRGRDYVGPGDFGRYFTDEQADTYDETIRAMSDLTDPYEAAISVWQAMGLVK